LASEKHSDDVIFHVRGLKAAYGDFVVLDGVDFDVRRGEVFAILGGSGCGKSTLLKNVLGVHEPVAGEVFIGGEDYRNADDATRRRILSRIGVTYQDGALFGSMSLSENVGVPLEEHTRMPAEARRVIARTKLQLVGLGGFEDFLPGEISGGMRKRAAIARAMALDPEVLCLDEPSAGLDPVTSAGLDKLIARLSAVLEVTFVMVTHELPSILSVVDRCILLDSSVRGVVAAGDPKKLAKESTDPIVRRFFDRLAEDDVEATTR
jgi:phospholipid/cholesterol/gamma-HCH transport system ATP-binding protein